MGVLIHIIGLQLAYLHIDFKTFSFFFFLSFFPLLCFLFNKTDSLTKFNLIIIINEWWLRTAQKDECSIYFFIDFRKAG